MKDFMQRIERKVQQFIDCAHLLQQDDRLLVALSGGGDSVCLLLLLLQLGYSCVAVHCNFHLRGEESLRDEAFVRQLCQRYGVGLHVQDFDTIAYARQHHLSIELAARNLRYDFFQQLLQTEHCTKLAVGHHQDDNVETFLLNAIRKTGVRGLCGIKPLSVNGQGTTVVRPLLCITHQEILRYLNERGEAWVTDSTNLEDDAARNRIRHHVIPQLQTISSASVGNLNATIQNLTEVLKVYDAEMERCIQTCVRRKGDTCYIDREQLSACISPISVLHALLSPLGFNETQIRNLLTAKGYRCNRPKGAKPILLPGQGRTAMVDVSWKTITVSLSSCE